MSMKKQIVYTFVIFVGSILCSGLLVESLVRLFYEPTTIVNPDEMPDNFAKYVYTPPKNRLGFRESELNNNYFHEDYIRILFLGDSFTHGHGIKKGEDRFSDIIESRLNQYPKKNGFQFHIYNAGIGGTEPKDWVQYLRKLTPIYNPQYVFAVFFLRDGTNLCTSLKCYKKKIKSIKANYDNAFWYKYTYIGRFIGNKLIERRFADYYLNKMKNSYLGSEVETQVWTEQQQYLLEIMSICKNRGIEFHLVIFPLLFGLESDYQFYDVENEISRFAKESSIPVFSLTNGFIGHKSSTLWVSSSDQHPNEKGHSIAANTLYPYLNKIINHKVRDDHESNECLQPTTQSAARCARATLGGG